MRQILLFIFISLACSVSAEQFKITGQVVDATDNDQQLIGATVTVEGTHRVVNTDFDGNFSIEVEKGEILKFSYVGFYSKVVEVLNDSALFVEMKAWHEFCFCPIRHLVLPDNHLKSSLKELQILFPDLMQCNDKSKMLTYKSGSILFSMCNGIVCKQYYTLDKYKNEVLERVYHGFVNSFKGYDSSKKNKSGKEITFYYPEYSVHIQYEPNERVSVTYELNPEYYK